MVINDRHRIDLAGLSVSVSGMVKAFGFVEGEVPWEVTRVVTAAGLVRLDRAGAEEDADALVPQGLDTAA
jgi:hypothetical protein